MSQITLIEEKNKGGKIIYEVQRDGIMFLRKLKHKKLRIIFNITYQNHSLSDFNQGFFNNQKHSLQEKKCNTSEDLTQKIQQAQTDKIQIKNRLTIHTVYKQIQNNRTIVSLNAYQRSQSDPSLLVVGYLASSAIFYHNYQQRLTESSNLTKMLNNFSTMLKKTNIDSLNQQIKYKSGFSKTPYFLCIFTTKQSTQPDQNFTSEFNEFYRYTQKQQNATINNAVQTFVDYFPERSSILLQTNQKNTNGQSLFQKHGRDKIQQLGHQFETNILGRHLFNFQFTGTTLENLCFQMCDYFANSQRIDLLKAYNKIILNQKSRVYDEAIKLYFDSLGKTFYFGSKVQIDQLNTNSIFPISQFQLTERHRLIQDKIISQAFQDAVNCMSLQQFSLIYNQLKQKICNIFQKLKTVNLQKGLSFCDQCFNILQNIQFPTDVQTLTSEQIAECFQCITYKAELFSNQCLGLFAERDSNAEAYNSNLLRLIKNYLQKLSQITCNYVQTTSLQNRSNILQIQTLKFDFKKIKAQNKKLSQEFQLQQMIIHEYKNKVSNYIKQQNPLQVSGSLGAVTLKQFYSMKKKIQELQQEVLDKNNHIDELTDILDRFQTKGYNQKNQLSNELTKLAKSIGEEVNKFYNLFQQIKNIEKTYQKAKKGLNDEKDRYIEQKKKDKDELAKQNIQLQKIVKEKNNLEQIINQAKIAIQIMKEVEDQFKEGINKLEIDTGSMSCFMAEKQNDLETYKKAAKLLIQQIQKGKCQNLAKFYKVTDNEQLKDLLKPIIKK